MKSTTALSCLSLIITAAAAPAAPALAQDQSTQTNDAVQLDEVVVQARRANESQQDVPVAITAVTAAALERESVTSVTELQRLVPSMQITQAADGNRNFTIRGSFSGFSNDPSVITYIDEVPVNARAFVYDIFDLRSVQQLRGPQGTEFGRNSTGGAVLLFSQRPDLDGPSGYATGTLGNFNERRLEGAVNIPLSETLAFRLAAEVERRDGFIESVNGPKLDYDNRDNMSFRGSVLWQPTDQIQNLTYVNRYRVRERRYPNQMVSLAGPCTGPTTPAPVCLYQPPFNTLLGVGNVREFFDQQQTLNSDQAVATADYNDDADRTSIHNIFDYGGDRLSFHNVTSLSRTKVAFSRDFDGTPVDIIAYGVEETTDSFYSDSYLSGKLINDRLEWRVGGLYSQDDADFFQVYDVFHFPVSATNPKVTTAESQNKSTALYGRINYDFSDWVEGLSLTAGYRYTWDDRTSDARVFLGTPTQVCGLQTLPVPPTGPVPLPNTDLATCTRSQSVDFSDDNYNITLNWKPTSDLLIYAATRKGYKTGGFNVFQTDPTLSQYEPEVVRDVEVGFKVDWRLGPVPLRTNVAYFDSNYTNVQSQVVLQNPSNGAVDILVLNKDIATGVRSEASISGFEIEQSAALTSWLDVSVFYSDLDATYDQFRISANNLNLAGQPVAGVIPTTFGASANLSVPLTSVADELQFSASYSRTGAAQSNAASAEVGSGRETVNARISLRGLFRNGAFGDGLDLSIFAKNLGDKVFCSFNPVVAGALTATCSEPRTFGVELGVRFGR